MNLERAQREKKLKLANPNFHVSRTRLSLKNLPKDLDEKKIRVCPRSSFLKRQNC